MLWRIRQFAAIAWISLLETIRQPVFLLVLASGLLFIALLPLLITHTMGEGARLVRDNGLAVQWIFGLALGGTAAGTSLTHELRRGTGAVVLAKPVDRRVFFLAKYAGLAAAMLIYCAGACMATILSAGAAAEPYTLDWWALGPLLAAIAGAMILAGLLNYFTPRPFVSQAVGWLIPALFAALLVSAAAGPRGASGGFGAHLPWSIAPVSLLVGLAVLMLSGLALALATRLETLPTLLLCGAVFLLGLVSDHLLGRPAQTSRLAAVLHGLIPNGQHFWAADALAGDGLPWSYVARAALYASAWLAGVLALGAFSFERMEVRS